ncbi:hypothetical protein D3C85_1641110 [compost metagenome]
MAMVPFMSRTTAMPAPDAARAWLAIVLDSLACSCTCSTSAVRRVMLAAAWRRAAACCAVRAASCWLPPAMSPLVAVISWADS